MIDAPAKMNAPMDCAWAFTVAKTKPTRRGVTESLSA
eukprot:CAMPEP_0119531946 /NCGR_PEP_ID=MMETSP1344-20130328/45554_1 /TAXON_ID=236787 /ORGANISM="Florenciella parvula, Strain CCMP2471" /LENGTH=36 /DNA_ID= /DNA_START= /DNA_END= /DNA_ORIENTATION=